MDGSFVNQIPAQNLSWKEKLFASVLSQIEFGAIDLRFPSGNQVSFVGKDTSVGTADIHLHSWAAINRIIKGGAIGLGESYMDGEWETQNLTNLLSVLAANMMRFEARLPSIKRIKFLEKFRHFLNRNTKSGSRKNISYHYDLGNDFYGLWLDETMSYSSAVFSEQGASLAEAQTEKYARLARQLDIQPEDKVLEIGCGWGGFAEYAVTELGCEIDCITLSQEQLVFAENRLSKIPQGTRASFSLTDYRDMTGSYDKIVSIEMLEAVGEAYWPGYFQKVKQLLKPEGRAGIQVITIDDERFETYRKGADFIQKHIFPGGMLPSDRVFKQQTETAGLSCFDEFDFGFDYAQTLAEWRDSFAAKLSEVKALGFDDQFVRMWFFYLAYCEAGFRQKTISVKQYVIGK